MLPATSLTRASFFSISSLRSAFNRLRSSSRFTFSSSFRCFLRSLACLRVSSVRRSEASMLRGNDGICVAPLCAGRERVLSRSVLHVLHVLCVVCVVLYVLYVL